MSEAGKAKGVRQVTEARMVPCRTSYVGAVLGVLKAAGMCDLDLDRVMGLTGMAFHLIMHERCCPSSVTAYDWADEHRTALERLGVLSEIYLALPGSTTYEAARRRAVTNIKAAIDRGVGVVLWGVGPGEFGVVYGYDDADGVFLVDGSAWQESKAAPILFENVGRTFESAPILYYQVPVEKVDDNLDRSYRASLEDYIRYMEGAVHCEPVYRCGLGAYDNWLRYLEKGTYDPFCLRYNTAVVAEARQCAARYVRFLADQGGRVPAWNLPVFREAATYFEKVAEVYGRLESVLSPQGSCAASLEDPITRDQATALHPLLREARALEAETVKRVKAALA